MPRKQFIHILSLALLAACASPSAPTSTVTPALTLTATAIPSPTGLPNCAPSGGHIQQECTSPATGLKFWAYVPSDSSAAPVSGWPLLIYLHGSDLRGNQLYLVLVMGVPDEIEHDRDLAMIAVSPQCPYGENWQSEAMVDRLSRFVDEVASSSPVDRSRVYLTGFSMGGDGVWALGQAHPEQFAALAPVSSDWIAHDPQDMCVLSGMPIWVFQSETDELVSPKYARQNMAQVEDCGGSEVQMTLYPSGGHLDTARQAYAANELYQWFLKQK